MTDDELKKEVRKLLGEAIHDALKDPDERKKPAWASIAAAWLDGKGEKFKDEAEKNEFEQFTRQKMAGRDKPKLDLEGDDPATQ